MQDYFWGLKNTRLAAKKVEDRLMELHGQIEDAQVETGISDAWAYRAWAIGLLV